jgi:hypothetical protein
MDLGLGSASRFSVKQGRAGVMVQTPIKPSTRGKKFHPNFLKEIKERADLVDIISGYTHLKKRGKEYLGLCPFHEEKTPSFSVSPNKKLAYCFGCSWGGNAIKFVMEIEKASFAEAVMELARQSGTRVQYEDGTSEDYSDPLPRTTTTKKTKKPATKESGESTKDYTVSSGRVEESVFRLLHNKGDAEKARAWLENRGITREMVKRYRLGLEKRVVTPDESKPEYKKTYWAIAIFISVPNRPGRFYVKKRVAPWLIGDERPSYLGKWTQFGVPATIWFTHNPTDAEETYVAEGEWDAIALGELARAKGEKIAVACSTAGCGTVPKAEELDRLPGQVTTFFDRNDALNKQGLRPGDAGAIKLVAALGTRGQIGQVPMPSGCLVKGWDVSNALDAGYTWGDFQKAAREARTEPDPEEYADYIAWVEEQEALEGLKSVEPTAEDLWKLLHVPDEMQCTQRLSLSDVALQANFLCIKAPMASGKTHSLAQVCASAESLLIIVNTIALGEALAVRYRCTPYNHPRIKSGELDINNLDRLVITSESLWKIRTFNKKFNVVLIDEADQVLSSAVCSVTTRRKRQEILTNLEYFAHQSKRFVLMDADLSSPVVEFGQYLCGRKPYIVQNVNIPHSGEIFYQFESQDAHFAHICNLLEIDEKVLIVTDSKKKVKSLGAFFSGWQNIEGVENLGEKIHSSLQHQFPDKRGAIIHGDNSGKDEIRKLIKQINELLPVLKLDYLIFNSCVQSGVSIEVVNEIGEGYFNNLCCLFSGMTLAHTELGQVSHRWRPNDCEKSFSFAQIPNPPRLETSISKLERDLFASHWEEVQSLGINAKNGIPEPKITKFRIQAEARRNWSLNNIQNAFTKHLNSLGYEIIPHPSEEYIIGTDTLAVALKARGEVIDKALVATIIKSPLLDKKAYEQLNKKASPDYYDRALKTRYELTDFTGMDPTEKLVTAWLEENLRKKLTRLDFLFQPEQAAIVADLANRRKYHYAFDQKHNLLERQLLYAIDAPAYLDPNKSYTNANLKPLEVACKAQAAKIKRLLGLTIYQPPQYLNRGLKEAAEGIGALFDVSIHPLAKWLLGTLAAAENVALNKETFKSQESADAACRQLTRPGQIICDAVAVAIRHKTSDMSPSKIHAALCEALGLKRELAYQNSCGRAYRINKDTWDFAQAILTHRQQQREDRQRQKEEAIQQQATRFDQCDMVQMQRVIESEISEAIANSTTPPLPDLVYSHTPPEIYKLSNLGGVCESQVVDSDEQKYSVPQKVQVDDEVTVPRLGQTGQIVAFATGRDEEFNFHDYIQVLIKEKVSKWVPASWATSSDGQSVRPNPIPDPNFTPLRTRQTWANWLLAMANPKELFEFEERHTLKEIESAVIVMPAFQLEELQIKFTEWGIEREWLPPASETRDLAGVLSLGLQNAECLRDYVAMMHKTFNAFSLRRTWQSLSRELKKAIASLAPETLSVFAWQGAT